MAPKMLVGISNVTAIKPKSLSHAMTLEMLVLINLSLALATSLLTLTPNYEARLSSLIVKVGVNFGTKSYHFM